MLESSLAQMERMLRDWERIDDRRAVFLDCYTRMTRAMCTAIERGEFEDPAWVDALLVRFAWYYFDSVEAWDCNDERLARPWQLAHDATRSSRVSTLQLMLAGVNAHINYDLALTLVDLIDADRARGAFASLRERRHDYDHVNRVIRATADEVQDEVLERYAPRFDLADKALLRIDEWATVRLLTSWRNNAWRHATALIDMAPTDRAPLVAKCSAGCERRSRRILLGRPPTATTSPGGWG